MNRLSAEVVSALRTDVTITSAPQCITELVLNSIDAKATSIAVRVDLNLFKLHVIDNGCGISENDLSLLGYRYVTSKCHSVNDLRTNLCSFGFRGEALASLCEVAGTVMITSRPAGSNDTYCKIITQGCHQKVVPSSRPRPAQGTTILVADFLYNRPVRRSRVKAAFDLEDIKVHLENIALIHPQVSLSLRDDASGQIILETKKSNSITDTFSLLFGPDIAKTLCAVRESSKPFEVSGYISKEAYSNKSLQFIYINKRLLLKSKLHKLVNSIMGRSTILKVNNVPHNPIPKEFNSAFFLAMSPPKRAKHAVYVLNITCPYSEYDITLDPKKTLIEFKNWDTILNCIEKLLRNFLEPQVTPDSPVKGSSLFDEIDRLAREDALAKGGDFNADLGMRAVLGLPARRDTVVYTPPSQYTQESTTVASDSQNGDSALRTCCSEDPFPRHLRGKAAPIISSENPFPSTRPANRNHDFDTTSQEESSTVSTKDFLSMFKQPVFHRKLKHPKPQTKLPVGGSLHFDLNFQRITSMMLPVENMDTETAERKKRSFCNSLQRFSMEKAVQLNAANDTAIYHTPVNAPVASESQSKKSVDSLADLPYASDLEARPGTPHSAHSPVHQINSIENTEIALRGNHEIISDDGLLNQICNERESSESSAEQNIVLRIDETDFPACVLQDELNDLPSEDVILHSQQENFPKHSSEDELREKQVFSPDKVFMRSEDFLITREDVGNSKKHFSGFLLSTSMASLPVSNLSPKPINGLENDNNSHIAIEPSLLETESGSVCCAQPEPCSVNLTKVLPSMSRRCFINHQGSSEELCRLNYGQSSAEPEESSHNSREMETRGRSSNTNQMNNSPIIVNSSIARVSVGSSKLISEVEIFSSSSNLSQEKCVKDDSVVNTRKRNSDTLSCADEPLNKIVSSEKSYFKSFKSDDCNFSGTMEVILMSKSPKKSQYKPVHESDTPECDASITTSTLKRHSVVLNCSINSLVSILSPKQNRIFKDSVENKKLNENNETLKSSEDLKCRAVDTSRFEENTGLSREGTGIGTVCDAVPGPVSMEVAIGATSAHGRNVEEFGTSSSSDESLIGVYDRIMLESHGITPGSMSKEIENNNESSAELLNIGEFGISSSRDESLIAVYDRVILEKSDITKKSASTELDKNSNQLQNTIEFGIPSSRDESLSAVYDGIIPDKNDVTTKSASMKLDKNSDKFQNTIEFGIPSSRDESLSAVYDRIILEKNDVTTKSASIEEEENGESSAQFQHSSKFRISSSRDESLVAVYDRTMLGNDRGEAISELTQYNALSACDQEVDANLVAKAETLTDESDRGSNDWEEHSDSMGRKFLIHSRTGAIRSIHDKESFVMEDRCRFVSKGLSPLVGSTIMLSLATHHLNTKTNDSTGDLPPQISIFQNQIGLETAKWPNGKREDDLRKSWPLLDQLLTTCAPEKEIPVASAMIQDQPRAQIKVYNVCYPYTFSKDIFKNLRVLGQLDRKFIVTIGKLSSSTEQSDVVILFDQHAVHERIRVEQLTKDYREPGEGIVWRSAPVHPALPLALSAREVRVMTNCSNKLRSLGLRFSKNDSYSVRITGVPTCLLLREDREIHGRGTSVLKSHLECLIKEEVEALIQTRGAGVEQPAIIRNVIASEACRGAVKFGHILETRECRAFLHNLSSCDAPFQCAHGRPALTPIADLSHLRRPTMAQKINLWKLRRT